jgi:lipopolysaccharide export system permease protein
MPHSFACTLKQRVMTVLPTDKDAPEQDHFDSEFYILNWGTLDRYILKALWLPLVFGVGAFLGISLTLGSFFELLRKVSDKGLPLDVALRVFGLQIPSSLILALPMATLLSCLLVYNRFARTSEIIAFRSIGVNAWRLARPGLLLALIVTGLTYFCSNTIVPQSNYQANQLLAIALHQEKPPFVDKNIFYREFEQDTLKRVFYARRFDGKSMQDLTILEFNQGNLNQIWVTDAAVWNGTTQVWDLQQGTVYELDSKNAAFRRSETFAQRTIPISRAPLDLATENRKADEMDFGTSYRYWQLIKGTGDEPFTRKWAVRLNDKLAFPLVCMVFALVGIALGMGQKQRVSSKGFGFSIVIIFGYYTISFITKSLGEAGVLSVFLGAWLPTIAGLAIGAVMLYQVNK